MYYLHMYIGKLKFENLFFIVLDQLSSFMKLSDGNIHCESESIWTFSKWSDIWNLMLPLINVMYSWKQNKFLIFIEDSFFYKSNTMNFKVFFLISLCIIEYIFALKCLPCNKSPPCKVSFFLNKKTFLHQWYIIYNESY